MNHRNLFGRYCLVRPLSVSQEKTRVRPSPVKSIETEMTEFNSDRLKLKSLNFVLVVDLKNIYNE